MSDIEKRLLVRIRQSQQHLAAQHPDPSRHFGRERLRLGHLRIQANRAREEGWVAVAGGRWLGDSSPASRKRASRALAALADKKLIQIERTEARATCVRLTAAGKSLSKSLERTDDKNSDSHSPKRKN